MRRSLPPHQERRSVIFLISLFCCSARAFNPLAPRLRSSGRVLGGHGRLPVSSFSQLCLANTNDLPQQKDPTTSSSTLTDPASSSSSAFQVCLQTLENRIQHGPGALNNSPDALETLDASIATLRQELQRLSPPGEEESPPSSNNNKYEPVPVVSPTAVHVPMQKNTEQDAVLQEAIRSLNTTLVSNLLQEGATMDAATTDAAFWATVRVVDTAEARDEPLPADVATMLHHIFQADHALLLQREQLRVNITCRQPDGSSGLTGAARRMNYVFDDGDHKNLPLVDGRICEGGTCCDACSRNIFPTFCTEAESDMETFPELASFTFNELEKVSAATVLQFVRLIERVRRSIAYEYGLPLSSILPLQAYSRKYVAGTTQRGGGGGEGDFVILHTDEATHAGYHYSCVLYLSTHGEDFEGGNFVFNDPAEGDAAVAYADDDDEEEADDEFVDATKPVMSLQEEIRRAGRELTPFQPTRGAAVIFSSGWENMHEVEKITSGIRYAIPCFFTTCPVPDAAYEQMVAGKPQTTEDIADDWLHLLLAHRKESPMESVGRVKELMMKWHTMCTPLSEH